MHLLIHLIVNFFLAYLLEFDFRSILIITLAGILIDCDHLLKIFDHKDRTLIKARYIYDFWKFTKEINYNQLQKRLHIFHTFEVTALFLITSHYFPSLNLVALGFLIHLATDALGNILFRNILHKGEIGWSKFWFLSYYILKVKKIKNILISR